MSQVRLDDGLPANVISIPSTILSPNQTNPNQSISSPSNRRNHNVVIGSNVGPAVFLLLAVFAITYCFRRSQRKSQKQSEAAVLKASMSVQGLGNLGDPSIREIDDNSMVGPVRELPDTGKSELRNVQSSGGSENVTLEMPKPISASLHEMRTQRSSQEMLMIEASRATRCKGLEPCKPLQGDSSKFHSKGSKSVFTYLISASNRESIARSSTDSVDVKTQIYASYIRKPLDLNRSLPPTPITESPMISPITPRFTKNSAAHERSQSVGAASPLSAMTPIKPRGAVSIYLGTVHRHAGSEQDSLLAATDSSLPHG